MEYDLDVDTNEAEQNHWTIFINHRLTAENGKFLGVVGVGLDFDRVASLLDDYKTRYNRNIYMVSPDGVIQNKAKNKGRNCIVTAGQTPKENG